MSRHLDKCIKAINYSITNPYRWSEKHKLLKRGYTIDTWDFQSNEDAKLSGGDSMVITLNKTRFGIMFGNNTGMSQSCRFLAEMLSHMGRNEESKNTMISQKLYNRKSMIYFGVVIFINIIYQKIAILVSMKIVRYHFRMLIQSTDIYQVTKQSLL